MTAFLIILAFAAMCAAAVNSGFEVGIYSLSRVRLRYRLEGGDPRAFALNALLEKPEQLISAILVAQNAAVYFITAVVSSLLEGAGARWAELWASLILSVTFFVFVEALPKNVFRHSADVLVYPLSRLYTYVLVLLKPAILFLRGVTHVVVGFATKGRGARFDPVFTRERLAFYLNEGHSEGVLSRYQVQLTQNILRGETVTVERAMIPLSDVVAVEEQSTWGRLRELARRKGFSRYPVFRGSEERIVGILNLYDCPAVETDEAAFRGAIRPAVYFNPETHVTDALRIMRDARQPMGVVVSRETAVGIVTVKDCVEEIVGELYEW